MKGVENERQLLLCEARPDESSEVVDLVDAGEPHVGAHRLGSPEFPRPELLELMHAIAARGELLPQRGVRSRAQLEHRGTAEELLDGVQLGLGDRIDQPERLVERMGGAAPVREATTDREAASTGRCVESLVELRLRALEAAHEGVELSHEVSDSLGWCV